MVESSEFNWDSIVDTLNANHVPEIFLGVVGIIAILIAYMYVKDKEGAGYKILVLIGVIAGIVMAVLCASSTLKADKWTLLIVVVASFALIIRPFRDVNMALIVALLAMILVYISLGNLSGDLEVLSNGWPRIIVAFIVGGIIYMLLGFLQDLMHLFGKILNAWPLLIILGVICIIEAVCVYTGHGSIIGLLMDFINQNKQQSLMLL